MPLSRVQAVFVDGENMSRSDMATLDGIFPSTAAQFIYQSEVATQAPYPGYIPVIVPYIGKESVDKLIGMDIVAGYYSGLRDFAIVSNDRDFGATALHLQRKFSDISVQIISNAQTSQGFVDLMLARGVRVSPLKADTVAHLAPPGTPPLASDPPLRTLPPSKRPALAYQVRAIMLELQEDNRLCMAQLGVALQAQGVQYEKLRKFLIKLHLMAKVRTKYGMRYRFQLD